MWDIPVRVIEGAMDYDEHEGIGEYPPRERNPVQPVQPPSQAWEAPVHQQRQYYGRANRAGGSPGVVRVASFLGLSVAVAGAGWLIVGGLMGAHERPEKPASADAFAPQLPAGFDSSRAVTLCDLNMQRQAISPSAYRSDWSWKIATEGQVVAIRRGFQATNVMNVAIRGEYTCLVAATTGRIIGLQYRDGDREITIPGSSLSN